MKTEYREADDAGSWLQEAARIIHSGGLVALATETVYGLAGDATSADAVAAIYFAKGRPSNNPLIVHIPGLAAAKRLAVFSDTAEELANRHWPGPLTLVLPVVPSAQLASAVTAGGASIAVRCPQGPLAALAKTSQRPLAAPSANLSGTVSPTTAEHVRADLDGRIAMVIDSGPAAVGLESTIVDVRGDEPIILRPGALSAEALCMGLLNDASDDEAPVAPGLLSRHYAPSHPLRLDVSPGDVAPHEIYLSFGQPARGSAIALSEAGDLEEAARHLYAALRLADRHAASSGKRGIAVAPIPETGVGVAIRNRLLRAASASG
ncbi:MAG: L-threonylcarbamoyladenylate synthase [Pseudomonadota bacterium]